MGRLFHVSPSTNEYLPCCGQSAADRFHSHRRNGLPHLKKPSHGSFFKRLTSFGNTGHRELIRNSTCQSAQANNVPLG